MPLINRRELGRILASGIASAAIPGSSGATFAGAAEDVPVALDWVQLHPGVWKATIGLPEPYTPVKQRLIPPALEKLGSLPRVQTPPLASPLGAVTRRGSLLRFALGSDEMIYGFGLQLHSFEQTGKKKTIRVNADPSGDTGDSHAPVPFYVSTTGYGVLVDSCRQMQFYCGDAHRVPGAQKRAGTNAKVAREANGVSPAHEVIVEVPRTTGVEVYLFAGPTMRNAVQRYNLFSGGGTRAPEWGLGFWYRALAHASQSEVLSLARELRERKIPCDVLGLEPGWQSHSYSCSFTWDHDRFSDPHGFLNKAADLGYHVNLWEHAFTHPTSPLFEPLLPHSGDYGVWGGLVPDFAGEPARKIFGSYHGTHFIDAGVSGFKLDECDNSDFKTGWSFPDMSQFPSGPDGEQMHGVFGLRYQHALYQPFLDRKQSTFSLVRSSGALAAPYPFVLYSDLYDHRDFIRALVNSGFCGLLWCPEVRDAKGEEDLIRRLQSVVFSPLAMVNAWYIKNPPWKQVETTLNNSDVFPTNWEALEARCREIIGWRMQLVPYILAAFERYAHDGTPPFRSLILDYPEDVALRGVDDEFLVGDRMLVAPLFAGEVQRDIKLPKGKWHDFWTGALVEGGSAITVAATAKNIPVFVKQGSVIPLAEVGLSSSSEQAGRLVAKVYGNGSLPWRLDDQDGIRFEISFDQSNGRVKVEQNKAVKAKYEVVRWEQMG
jgi:alpha-D-xyloside xylohydrolase